MTGARIAALLLLVAPAVLPLVFTIGVRPETVAILLPTGFLHARLVDGGGHTYVAAMHNGAYSFSHMEYPLLAPGAVADAWRVAGSRDYRLGQVLIGLLGASLLVVAGSLGGRVARGRWRTPIGAALAVAVVLAAFGASGPYASDGYVDLAAAAAALAA